MADSPTCLNSRELRQGKVRHCSTDSDDELPDLSHAFDPAGFKKSSSTSFSGLRNATLPRVTPKVEAKPEEMEIDNDKEENQKENLGVGMGEVGRLIAAGPAAAAAVPAQPIRRLEGLAAGFAHFTNHYYNTMANQPLFQPGLFAGAPPALPGGVPVVDHAARLKAIRDAREQAARDLQAAAAARAGVAGPSNRPIDPERTLKNDDDEGQSSDDEEHRTRVEDILAGGGGPVEQG